jgi:hypothetical protein
MLDIVVYGFGEVPIRGERSVGEAFIVLEALGRAGNESFTVRGIDEGVENARTAELCEMKEKTGGR